MTTEYHPKYTSPPGKLMIEGRVAETVKNTIKKDIMELIRLSAFNSDQIDQILTQTIQMTLGEAKGAIDSEKIAAEVKKRMLSEDYLKKYIQLNRFSLVKTEK